MIQGAGGVWRGGGEGGGGLRLGGRGGGEGGVGGGGSGGLGDGGEGGGLGGGGGGTQGDQAKTVVVPSGLSRSNESVTEKTCCSNSVTVTRVSPTNGPLLLSVRKSPSGMVFTNAKRAKVPEEGTVCSGAALKICPSLATVTCATAGAPMAGVAHTTAEALTYAAGARRSSFQATKRQARRGERRKPEPKTVSKVPPSNGPEGGHNRVTLGGAATQPPGAGSGPASRVRRRL